MSTLTKRKNKSGKSAPKKKGLRPNANSLKPTGSPRKRTKGRVIGSVLRQQRIVEVERLIIMAKREQNFEIIKDLEVKLDALRMITVKPIAKQTSRLKARSKFSNTNTSQNIVKKIETTPRGGNEMTEKEINSKRAELSREINYFSKLMSNFDKTSLHANAAQQKLIEIYRSFSNDKARMEWLEKRHEKLVSL